MNDRAGHVDPAMLAPLIASYRTGNDAAADDLVRLLTPTVRRETARMLGDADGDLDDVVQESHLSALRYLRAEASFEGDAVRLAVTIARNRCRDLLRHRARRPHVAIEPLEVWLTDTSRSALDDVDAQQRRNLLQGALNRLSSACRKLLHQLYVQELTPEQVRERSGLDTVQGVYYRRGVCLDHAKKFLQRRLRFGSGVSPGADRTRQTGESDHA
jgi:RNA polymerase sigma factor (sigma-70 family)